MAPCFKADHNPGEKVLPRHRMAFCVDELKMNLLHQSEHQRVFEHHVMFLSTGHSHLEKHFSQHVFHGLLASALFVFHVPANTGLAGFQVPKPAKPVLTKQDEKVCDPGEAKTFLKQTEIKTCWHVYHHSSRVVGKNWVWMGEKMLGGCLTPTKSPSSSL